MSDSTDDKRVLHCDTCGKETEHLHRDVLDHGYDATMKPAMWNCEACYRNKRAMRLLGGSAIHTIPHKQIFLTGFMATGKSKIGPILAHLLDRAYVDTDEMVVNTAGKSIADIFDQDGEDVFRELEHECLLRAEEMPDAVVALGGGAITFDRNWGVMRRCGICLCIRATPEVIYDRVTRREGKRPLLSGLSDEERMAKIREMLAEREPFYLKADLIVDSKETQAPEETAVDAVRVLRSTED